MLTAIFRTFLEGLLTPLGAVCVLPLYPGFIAYLARKKESPLKLGLMITLGVISFMFILGLIFTTLLKVSLTKVIGIISPLAFIVLGIVSIMMILNFDFSKYLPKVQVPGAKHPLAESYLFGFFFGLIVIPCNPGFIALLFADVLATAGGFATSMLQFLSFSIGLAFPLLVLSVLSESRSRQITGFLTKHQRKINVIAGTIMLAISLYYLIFNFKVFG